MAVFEQMCGVAQTLVLMLKLQLDGLKIVDLIGSEPAGLRQASCALCSEADIEAAATDCCRQATCLARGVSGRGAVG